MSALSRAEHPVWEDGGRLVPANTLANASTARPTYRRLHHIPEMSHTGSEVACFSRTAFFFSLPAGVTVPRTSCRFLASARPGPMQQMQPDLPPHLPIPKRTPDSFGHSHKEGHIFSGRLLARCNRDCRSPGRHRAVLVSFLLLFARLNT